MHETITLIYNHTIRNYITYFSYNIEFKRPDLWLYLAIEWDKDPVI